MIIALLLRPIFALLRFAVNQIPMLDIDVGSGVTLSALFEIMGVAFYVFPASLFFIFIGNVVFWMSAHMAWAVVEWVYKKIPGIN